MTSKIMSKFSPRLWAMFAFVNDNEKSGCPLNSPKPMNNYDLNENSSGYVFAVLHGVLLSFS